MTFNGEQVSGSPFLCRVTDDGDDDEEILDGIAPPDFASTALDGDDGKGLKYGRLRGYSLVHNVHQCDVCTG